MEPLTREQLRIAKGIFISLPQLSRMLGRHPSTVRVYWADRKIPAPIIDTPPIWHRDQFTAEYLEEWRSRKEKQEH